MNNILTLLKLEFKSKYSGFSVKSKKSWSKIILSLGFYALLLYLVYTGAILIFKMFDKAGMAYEALVILLTAVFLFLLITGISSTIKVLYYRGDNLILMRFPVSGSEVFISKTLFLLISHIIMTATIVVPFLIAYGTVINVKMSFYTTIPAVVLFLVLIPFFLSNIFAIPIMHLTNKIRNKFGLILIMLSILMTGMFVIYMLLFNSVVHFMRDSNFSVFSDEFVGIVVKVTGFFIPTKFFADIMLHKELFYAYPSLIMLTAVSLCGTIIVIKTMYSKTLLTNIEIEGSAFKHKTKNKKTGIFRALLKKEFIQVFRSVNYSFQYFVLALSMPVMVYFCNSIAMEIGRDEIGEQIFIGMTILVMLIFATVITSFSATSVTREGNNFYHTKVMPVSIQKQLFAKFIMYFIVSFIANFICTAILVLTDIMTINTAAWVFGLVETLSVALTLRSMRYDIRKPHFNLSGEGEVVNNNANTSASIGLGFFVAIAEGMIAMATAYLFTLKFMMIICSATALIIAAYCVFVYFFRLKKTYDRIVK